MNCDDVLAFEAAWRSGSFTAAATELGLAQATLSRRIARLEQDLGHRLFHRGGGLRLTDVGENLLPQAKALAGSARTLLAAAESLDEHPHGQVRVAVPPGMAAHIMAPLASRLREEHPDIVLEVLADIRYLDLAAGEADIAIRARPSNHPELVHRVIGRAMGGVYASPDYIATLPEDWTLASLDWVGFSDSMRDLPQVRYLHALVPEPRYSFRSDNYIVQAAAAQNNMGAFLGSDLDFQFLPRLQRLPIPVEAPVIPIYMVLHRATRRVPRIRAVADFMVRQAAAPARHTGDHPSEE